MVIRHSLRRTAPRRANRCAPVRILLAVVLTAAVLLAIAPAAPAQSQLASRYADEPLSSHQWYLGWNEREIRSTDGEGVSVGVIDTGIDSSLPELTGAYNAENSHSFLSPDVCDAGSDCQDPGIDPLGHGTGVAGVIASAQDGYGIGGAAPGVDLVSLRAGGPTGTFSASAVAQAIRYGADADLDVVVMAFTVDPWFRYCDNAPGDTPRERAQQAVERAQVEDALDYAADKGVILIAAAGNESFDLDLGTTDRFSAAWAGRGARTVNDQCVTLPAQSDAVITVGAINATGERAVYSNTGADVDIAAPGGDPIWYDSAGRVHGREGAILAPVPEALLRNAGLLNDRGGTDMPEIVADCSKGSEACRYYRYGAGTSYAAPQVAAAAAILLSQGTPTDEIRSRLMSEAVPISCPEPDSQAPSCGRSQAGNTWYGSGRLRLAHHDRKS